MADEADHVQRRRLASRSLGFIPLIGLLRERRGALGAQRRARRGSTTTARRPSASDPAWTAMTDLAEGPRRQDRLRQAARRSPPALGQEFSADNAFQTGKVAMNLDGEYRTAFIDDQAPDLNYGTAPFPTADDHDRPATAPATSPATSSASRKGVEEPRGRLGAAEVPDDRTPTRRSSWPTGSRTCRRRTTRSRRPDLEVDDAVHRRSSTSSRTRTRRPPRRARNGAGYQNDLRGLLGRSGSRARSATCQAGLTRSTRRSTTRSLSTRRRDRLSPRRPSGPSARPRAAGRAAGGSGSSCCRCWRPGCSAC